jgi:MFS family permease
VSAWLHRIHALRVFVSTAARGLVAMFVSTFLELTGFFMFGPLLLFMLKERGLETAATGLFGAALWAGILLGTPFAATWVRRLGSRGALLLSVVVPLLAMTGIALTAALWAWAVLYFIAGLSAALRWIVAEATVAELAPAHRRGRIVGAFETMVGVTFVAGPALLAALGTSGPRAAWSMWCAVALVALGAAATLAVPRLPGHPHDAGTKLGWRGILDAWRASPVVMAAGFVGGFFEAGLAGLLPLYGLAMGFSAALSALLVSASGLGSAVMMVPLGEAADRTSLRTVLLACAGATLAGTLLLPLVPVFGVLAWPIAFLWGGAGGALYTLAMVAIGHRHQGVALVNATAVLVLSYTAGGMLAPALGGAALQWTPALGFPALLALVATLGLAVLLRSR